MAQNEDGILQTALPAIQTGIAALSLSHPVAAVLATVFTTPLVYQVMVSTALERERMSALLNETYGAMKTLENSFTQLKSAMGEDLLAKALTASRNKPGTERIIALARVLASFNGMEKSYIEASDFIVTIDTLSEPEWMVLKIAYELYPRKEIIGKTRESNVNQLPHILSWEELHLSFPNLTAIELNFIFSAIERTGLVMKEHGHYDDNGDVFSFTPNLKRLMDVIAPVTETE